MNDVRGWTGDESRVVRRNGWHGHDWRRRWRASALMVAIVGLAPNAARAQHLLVPMDDSQTNHLKAYGLTFNALRDGNKAEWFINYRGGSFLLPDLPELRKRATLDGVAYEAIDNGKLQSI